MSTTFPPSSTKFSDTEMEKCPYLQGIFWRKSYLTDDTFGNLVAITATNSVAFILNILLNVLMIFAVATRRPLRTNSNILLACLAGSDLLAGLICHPVAIAVELKRILGDAPFCSLEKVIGIALVQVSCASLNLLLLIGIDRYVAVKHALRYRHIVTKRRMKAGVFSASVITGVFTIHEIILAAIDSETKTFSDYMNAASITLGIIGFLYICAIGYIYVYIFRESRRQSKRLQTEQLSQEEAKRLKKNRKAATTLAIILAALMVSYLPAMILLTLTSSHDTVKPHIMCVLNSWSSTFIILGSIFNPLIYCWRNKKLRRAFLEILHFREPENSPPEIVMVKIKRHRPEIQPTTCEAFSAVVVKGEPVLLSFRRLNDDETPLVSIPHQETCL